MATYMHCRPCYGTNIPIYSSSFAYMDPNYHNHIPASYHYHHHYDQRPAPIQLPSTTSSPRRRRRLQDPITTYASNYYATLPRQMSREPTQQSSSPTLRSQIPPLPPSRRNVQQSNHKGLYCDLYNLLEHSSSPSPPPPSTSSRIRHRRKHNSPERSPTRHPRYHNEEFEKVHSKSKNTNDHRRFNQRSHYSKERKRHDDKLSPTEQYGQLTKKTNDIYQRRSSNKGFFRRIVCNYFCVPSTLANNGYSS